jgi:cephalosporin hydroxylase
MFFPPYKGLECQQQEHFLTVFEKFFKEVNPATIVEIGTGSGGTSLALVDLLHNLGQLPTFISYETHPRNSLDLLRDAGIVLKSTNIFTDDYQQLRPEHLEEIKSDIQRPGTTVLMCDGGNKINEVNLLVNLLKPGDFIMAHDYGITREYFDSNIRSHNLWHWCEITFADVQDQLINNLCASYMQDEFQSVVWLCQRKQEI